MTGRIMWMLKSYWNKTSGSFGGKSYGAVSGSGYTGLPTELDQGNLTEITAQPLLNYLVALSLRRGELQFSEENQP
jgi:hypothetical protein